MAARAADFLEGGLGFVDEAIAEGAQPNLDKGAVEEDLGLDVEVCDCFLEMGHQQHVACFVVLVVECKEIYLAEVGASADDIGAISEEIGAKGFDELCRVEWLGTRGNGRVKTGGYVGPGCRFEASDDLRRLLMGTVSKETPERTGRDLSVRTLK